MRYQLLTVFLRWAIEEVSGGGITSKVAPAEIAVRRCAAHLANSPRSLANSLSRRKVSESKDKRILIPISSTGISGLRCICIRQSIASRRLVVLKSCCQIICMMPACDTCTSSMIYTYYTCRPDKQTWCEKIVCSDRQQARVIRIGYFTGFSQYLEWRVRRENHGATNLFPPLRATQQFHQSQSKGKSSA